MLVVVWNLWNLDEARLSTSFLELLQSNELIVLANSSKKECSSHDMHKFIARVESLLVRINLGASFAYCFRTKVFSSDAAHAGLIHQDRSDFLKLLSAVVLIQF